MVSQMKGKGDLMKITQNETLKAEGVSSFDFEAETTNLSGYFEVEYSEGHPYMVITLIMDDHAMTTEAIDEVIDLLQQIREMST